MRNHVLPLVALLLAIPTFAQQSPNYQITDHVLDGGGALLQASTDYRVTLASVGVGPAASAMSSASYELDGTFASSYPPPGEVQDLRFQDSQRLIWDPEGSVGTYNLYRDQLGQLAGLGYGTCEQQSISSNTTTDTDPLSAGDGYFYLVTAENRLSEEGTKGVDGFVGGERPNPSPCP